MTAICCAAFCICSRDALARQCPNTLCLVFIDDLHFGELAVPAPGALALFGFAFALSRQRRQR